MDKTDSALSKILIIDFGSQFTQLIARKIRELGVYSEILSHNKSNKINLENVKGIILSGGPLNVYQDKKIKFDNTILKKNIPILGIIENMSTHICSNCGHEEYIFGKDGGSKMCLDYKTELLGSLPLDINIREGLDAGKPSIAINPNSDISEIYKKIARKSALKVLDLAEDHSSKFPNIVIQQS